MAKSQKLRVQNVELTRAMTHILIALVTSERHGYAIMTEITSMTNGEMRVGPGTLYRSISQMLKNGLIEEITDKSESSTEDQRRKYYRITGHGRGMLEAEIKRLEVLVINSHAKGVFGDPQWKRNGGY